MYSINIITILFFFIIVFGISIWQLNLYYTINCENYDKLTGKSFIRIIANLGDKCINAKNINMCVFNKIRKKIVMLSFCIAISFMVIIYCVIKLIN